MEYSLDLFYENIKVKNYDMALKCWCEMFNGGYKYSCDLNFYLLLLGSIFDLPDNYVNYVSSLDMPDIRIDYTDDRYSYHDILVINKYRLDIFCQKYYDGSRQLSFLPYDRDDINYLITCELFNQANHKHFDDKDLMFKWVKQKKYEDLFKILSNKRRVINLSYNDECLFVLIRDMLYMYNNNFVYESSINYSDRVYFAINMHDYYLAKKISDGYRDGNMQEEIRNCVLDDVINLVNTINSKVSNGIRFLDEFKGLNLGNNWSYYCEFYNKLLSYDKLQYEFLIVDLMKISMLDGDMEFSLVRNTINDIVTSDKDFDFSIYVSKLNELIESNNVNYAKIYLDMVIKGSGIVNIENKKRVFNKEIIK